MSDEIMVGICLECGKPIYVSDKSFYTEGAFKNYHIKCFELKKQSEEKKD